MVEKMKKIEQIKELISLHLDTLKNKYYVKEIGIFGSYIREDQNTESDVDILVEFSKPVGLIDFIKLEEYLKDLLDINVDLVPRDGIKPALKSEILQQVVYV
jgi:predicted nucleotidyltransferase